MKCNISPRSFQLLCQKLKAYHPPEYQIYSKMERNQSGNISAGIKENSILGLAIKIPKLTR